MMSAAETRILAAAIELFASRSYDRTTIREIAARAGSNSALLYRSFGEKRRLFEEAVTRAVTNVVKPHVFLAEMVDSIIGAQGQIPDAAATRRWNSLMQCSGALVMRALTSGNPSLRRMVLATLVSTFHQPAAEKCECREASPAVHLRVTGFTDFRLQASCRKFAKWKHGTNEKAQ